jgi:tungstate transport system substrate-binding protein
VRGLTDAADAFARIARAKAPFMVNDNAGAKYLEEIFWTSAGHPAKGDWYTDPNMEGPAAVTAASQKGAYVLWGIAPFLRLKQSSKLELEPMVIGDPLFQRIMVAIVVNPEKVQGVNLEGAQAFEKYLISPATQARIRAFRYPGIDQQVWWPAGRHNNRRE